MAFIQLQHFPTLEPVSLPEKVDYVMLEVFNVTNILVKKCYAAYFIASKSPKGNKIARPTEKSTDSNDSKVDFQRGPYNHRVNPSPRPSLVSKMTIALKTLGIVW